MSEFRAERLAVLIKEELGKILQRELKDPRIGFASITNVRFLEILVMRRFMSVSLGIKHNNRLRWKVLRALRVLSVLSLGRELGYAQYRNSILPLTHL